MSEASRSDIDVVAALQAAFSAKDVLTGEDVTARASGIWRKAPIEAKAIVRPQDTEGVARAMQICHEFNQGVVAHGGLTGLVESAVASPDDVVISLERLNQIEEVNTLDRTMVVGSGTILQVVQEAAEENGLVFPLDLGGRGSCTIGGNIATNAGGNRVIRYGMARDMILGLEAVLADGTVVSSMNRMIKNNAGYDLKQLFIGTEGTLGIVTKAVLRLREQPKTIPTFFVAVDEFDKLPLLLKHMDGALGGTLSAFEVMWNNFYRIVTTEPARQQPPLAQDSPYYVLIEAMGSSDPIVEVALGEAYEAGLVVDAVIAQSEAQRLELWAMRDDVAQCMTLGPTVTFDVSLPISNMKAYVDEVNQNLAAEFEDAVTNFTFGHMGDGNLHFVVSPGRYDQSIRERVERCIYEPLAAIGGSVSAEHGVGLEKKPYLSISRSDTEIALMRSLKAALDPKGLLNPGKVFDLS